MGAKRVAYAVIGGLLVLVGAALLVLPGPGMLVVLAGLVLLSKAFPALRRHLAPVKARAMKTAEDGIRSPWRVAGSIATGLALIAAGLVWGLMPSLPFSSWYSGSSLIASGLILFSLLIYTARQVRGGPGGESGSARAVDDGAPR